MPDREFKAMITKILTGLEKRVEDIREAVTAEIKELNAGREQGLMEGALFCLGKAKGERRLLPGPRPGMPGDRCGDHKPLWTDCRGR